MSTEFHKFPVGVGGEGRGQKLSLKPESLAAPHIPDQCDLFPELLVWNFFKQYFTGPR